MNKTVIISITIICVTILIIFFAVLTYATSYLDTLKNIATKEQSTFVTQSSVQTSSDLSTKVSSSYEKATISSFEDIEAQPSSSQPKSSRSLSLSEIEDWIGRVSEVHSTSRFVQYKGEQENLVYLKLIDKIADDGARSIIAYYMVDQNGNLNIKYAPDSEFSIIATADSYE